MFRSHQDSPTNTSGTTRKLGALLIFTATLLLSACSTVPTTLNYTPELEHVVPKDYYDVSISTHDDAALRATVFQPMLAPGQSAPLVIHLHGFGVFRVSKPNSIYGRLIYSGQTALKAWEKGYWVLSVDQRGHGKSDELIRLMDPNFEVMDVSAIISWAEENIPRLSYEGKDPVIGMIGDSYGAGAGLMGSGIDHRIDAIIPIATWHSLRSALTPNDVPKTGWLTTLVASANILNFGHVHEDLNNAYVHAMRGDMPEDFRSKLRPHSMEFQCANGMSPDADALLIQGMDDVLFPLNEARSNRDCLLKAGRDVRLLGIQGGHQLPMTQWSLLPGWATDKSVNCGEQELDLTKAALSWFDEKLKGIKGAADHIPDICLTTDKKHGLLVNDIPVGGPVFEVPKTELKSGVAGFFEMVMTPVDGLLSLVQLETPPKELVPEDVSARIRPAFVPLYVAKKSEPLAGIPTATLKLEGDLTKKPTLFLGIGLKRNGSASVKLVSDQVTPIRGIGKHDIEMPGVSAMLEPGDQVGLIVSTYSNQYRFAGSGFDTRGIVHGELRLPLLDYMSELKNYHAAAR